MSKLSEKEIEREQIKWVFGLTGGELSDESFNGYAYNYEGAPSWCEEFKEGAFHTVIVTGGGFLPSALPTLPGGWKLQNTFVSSGETECPGMYEDGSGSLVLEDQCNSEREGVCMYCEEVIGTPHRVIYVGDSYEAVYQRFDRYTVHGLDVWGNDEDGEGFTVNDVYPSQGTLEVPAGVADRDLLTLLCESYLRGPPKAFEIEGEGFDGDLIFVNLESNDRPILELRRIDT